MSAEPEQFRRNLDRCLYGKSILNVCSSDISVDELVAKITPLVESAGFNIQEEEIDWNAHELSYWIRIQSLLQEGKFVVFRSSYDLPDDVQLQRIFMRNLRTTNEAAMINSKKSGSVIVVSSQKIDIYNEEVGRIRFSQL